MSTDNWESRYQARYNYLLHTLLRSWYHRLQMVATVLAAVTASTALAATFSAGPLASSWQVVLGASTLLSIIGPIMGWSDLEATHSALAMGYRALEWRLPKLTPEAAGEELAALEAQETQAQPMGWDVFTAIADRRTCQQLQVAHAPCLPATPATPG